MYELYTDGSCLGNPGCGGWACIIVEGKKIITSFQGLCCETTTNNEMELMAAINGINMFVCNSGEKEMIIISDSKYVIDGSSSWIKNWRRNGWRNSNGDLISNYELWGVMDKYLEKYKIIWKWVRGHCGNEFNEMANMIAVSNAKKAQKINERKKI